MIKNKILLSEIIDYLAKMIIKIEGNMSSDMYIDNLADAANVNEFTLDWINPNKQNKQNIAESSSAKIMLVGEGIVFSKSLKDKILLYVENPKVALAKIGVNFFEKKFNSSIHPTAIIDKNAVIGKNVFIGAYTVLDECIIGDNTIIHEHVRIYNDVTIGNNCEICSGAKIGGAGFGYEYDENENRTRFPQIGGVRIGNHVDIGDNTCIERGALTDTVIGDYTKIDDLCHIAHNNKIGKNVFIPAHVIICGSCVIEDNVWIAPNTSIREWLTIGANSTIGLGAVVVKDVPENEIWVGNPAKKIK